MRAEPADIVLLACVLNGDESGLAALLNRHWYSLVRYSFSILEDWDAAEDVAADVYVRLWEHRETWGLEGSVLGLLFRIARNLSVDDRRRQTARRQAAARSETPGRLPEPASSFDSKELHSAVRSAVADLPKRRREVFVLVRFHDLSYREAAEALGLAPQTVANHLSMALTDLKDALAPYLFEQVGDSKKVRLAGEAIGQ